MFLPTRVLLMFSDEVLNYLKGARRLPSLGSLFLRRLNPYVGRLTFCLLLSGHLILGGRRRRCWLAPPRPPPARPASHILICIAASPPLKDEKKTTTTKNDVGAREGEPDSRGEGGRWSGQCSALPQDRRSVATRRSVSGSKQLASGCEAKRVRINATSLGISTASSSLTSTTTSLFALAASAQTRGVSE